MKYLSEILAEKYISGAYLGNIGNVFHFDVYFMFMNTTENKIILSGAVILCF